jgi:intracellular septation protein
MWVANFSVLAAANLYVVYNFDEATWVNFKMFGMLGLTLVMVVIQAIWIATKTAGNEHQQEGAE